MCNIYMFSGDYFIDKTIHTFYTKFITHLCGKQLWRMPRNRIGEKYMNHQKIAIIVDSGSDVPAALREKYDMKMVSLNVIYPNEQYIDCVDIMPEEIYRRFPAEVPKTSLPSPDSVQKVLDQIIIEGYEKVLAVCISSNISGTYNTVKLVCGQCTQLESFVLDTKNISIGSGLLAIYAAKMLENGMSWEDLIRILPEKRKDSKVFFYMDTLEYLHKGGRIGLVTSVVGTALNLKPIISCNEQGVYYTVSMMRGGRKSISTLLRLATGFAEGHHNAWYGLMNGNAPDKAKEAKGELLHLISLDQLAAEGQIAPSMAVHTGPGLLGMGVLRVD